MTRTRFSTLLGAAAFLLSVSPFARAATIGTFTCNGLEKAADAATPMNVSAFTFGLLNQPTASAATPAQGFLELHLGLADFPALNKAVAKAATGQCTLAVILSDGSLASFVFEQAAVSSLTVVAGAPESKAGSTDAPTQTQYVDLQLQYADVKSNVTGADDGGSIGSPIPSGWNRVHNVQDTTASDIPATN